MHAQAKGRHSYGEIPVWRMKEVIQEAKAIAFPWDAIPSPIKEWLKAMGGAINTQPEFLLIRSHDSRILSYGTGQFL